MLADLDMGVKGGRDVGIDPETRNVTQRGGWQRQQSEPVNRMLDAGLSYQKIRKGLNDIVEDNGKENNTTAKRVELYVNDAVVNGYNSITEGRSRTEQCLSLPRHESRAAAGRTVPA